LEEAPLAALDAAAERRDDVETFSRAKRARRSSISLSAFERLAVLSVEDVAELEEEPFEEPLEADEEELDEVTEDSSSSSCFISN
jgi:DNA-binding SARP family transcriptional activator